VQSLHLLAGHEFIRLVEETQKSPIRTSIGLPLLTSPDDYQALCASLAPLINAHPDQAILLVGHGTDHPAWCAYPALQYFMRRHFGPRVFVGVLEECLPSSKEVIANLRAAGHKKVCIIPLLLVAGMHFHRDLVGESKDSWLNLLAQANISVKIVEQGIGMVPAIGDMFCQHIEDALRIIPDTSRPKKE
jgi:sirohydrochlorin cobaltochelatase